MGVELEEDCMRYHRVQSILELGFTRTFTDKIGAPEAKLFLYLRWLKNAIIKKSTNNKHWRGCGEKEPSCIVGRNGNLCRHYEE